MSHLKLSFGGERILTAAPLTQLNERRSTCTAVEYVCVCVLRGGGVGWGGVVDYTGCDLRLNDDRAIER